MTNSIYETLKSSTNIQQVCKILRLPIDVTDGYQDCPFCYKSKKLRINGPLYKCFNPNCGKKGDVITWLVDLKLARNLSESIKMLSGMLGINSNRQWVARLDILQTAFNQYKKSDLSKARSILEDRGLSPALDSIDFGYAPDSNYLQSCGMTFQDLELAGLVHKNSTKSEFFVDRIIFPIYNEDGQLIHLQGRACGNNVNLRWLSTSSTKAVASIDKFLFNSRILHYSSPGLFLCEGISDTLSLMSMGLPAIGCFGVNIDLCRHSHLFLNTGNLVVVIDSDRYEVGTPNAGNYKSWNAMIGSLISLYEAVPELNISCMMVPNEVGKDLNDWLLSGATKDDVLSHLDKSGKSLVDFCFALEESTTFDIKQLCRVVKSRPTSEALEKLNFLISNRSRSAAEFVLDFVI